MRTVSKNLATRRSFFMFPANEVALLHALDPIFVLMAAYGLALLFAGAAISKLASLAEFEGVVQNFRLLPRPLVKPVAWLLAPTELTVALGLAATTTRHGVIARAALDSRELSLRQEVDLRVAAPRSAKVW
jgi:hypothetical protein